MLKKITVRFRQFWISMFSKYTRADAAFARRYLNISEMAFFNQLPNFEKRHSVVVAKKMLKAVRHDHRFNRRKLAKLGLLHDVGKVVEHNSIVTKSILVLIRYFIPALYNRLADLGEDNQRFRRYYIHKHHGAVGAKLLAKLDVSDDIISMIKKHDLEPSSSDPVDLKILQEADSTY
jgi:putative nucleotidyltransferase with HDIG domain